MSTPTARQRQIGNSESAMKSTSAGIAGSGKVHLRPCERSRAEPDRTQYSVLSGDAG